MTRRPSSEDAPTPDSGAGRPRVTVRHLLTVLLAAGVVAVVVGGLLQFRIDTRLSGFLPDDPTVDALDEKADTFGGDPMVVLLESEEPRDLLLDPDQFQQLFALEGELSKIDNVATVYGPATVLNQIAGAAQALLAEISGRRDAIRYQAEAKARARGATKTEASAAGDKAVAAFELRYGRLLVSGLPAGLPTLRNPGFIEQVIYDDSGQARPRWRFVAPEPDKVAVLVRPSADLDQSETQRLTDDIRGAVDDAGLDTERVTVTGVPAVTAALADEVQREAPLLASLALLLLLARFVLVPSRGRWAGRLLPLLAAMAGSASALAVFGWLDAPLSLGAVVLLPLLLSIGSSFPLYLRSVGNRRRVLVSAAASAVAFASLFLSPLSFVRQLGLALGLGVVFTVLAGLALIRRPVAVADEADVEPPEDSQPPPRPHPSSPVGIRWAVGAAAVALAAGGWVGLASAEISADPRDLADGVAAIDDAEYAEEVLGSSGEVNVVLSGPDVLTLEALAWGQEAERSVIVRHGDELRPVITTPDLLAFLGEDPTPEQIQAGFRLVPPYITQAVVDEGRTRSLLTFGISLQSLEEQQDLIRDVRANLPTPPPGYRADVVGLPVAAARAYELVSEDRYLPNLAGIGAAGLVLALALRRRRDALDAVAAALLATGWTLGVLVLAGIPLTPLSIALGSLTTVTATEFHVLLADARRHPSKATSRVVAWAAITSALGYLVLVASSLTVLREFGLVLMSSVLMSYLAARVVVWARHPAPPLAGGDAPRALVGAIENRGSA